MQVPILKQGDYLIASIQASLTDSDLLRLRDDLVERVGRFRSRGVIVDVTVLDVMDSFAVRTLSTLAQMIMLRGAETVIVGIQPEVAFAMVQLGLTLSGVATALDLEEGLAYLNQRAKRSERSGRGSADSDPGRRGHRHGAPGMQTPGVLARVFLRRPDRHSGRGVRGGAQHPVVRRPGGGGNRPGREERAEGGPGGGAGYGPRNPRRGIGTAGWILDIGEPGPRSAGGPAPDGRVRNQLGGRERNGRLDA